MESIRSSHLVNLPCMSQAFLTSLHHNLTTFKWESERCWALETARSIETQLNSINAVFNKAWTIIFAWISKLPVPQVRPSTIDNNKETSSKFTTRFNTFDNSINMLSMITKLLKKILSCCKLKYGKKLINCHEISSARWTRRNQKRWIIR